MLSSAQMHNKAGLTLPTLLTAIVAMPANHHIRTERVRLLLVSFIHKIISVDRGFTTEKAAPKKIQRRQ